MPEPAFTLLPFGVLFGTALARLIAPRPWPPVVLACAALGLIALCALVTGIMDSVALAATVLLFLAAAAADQLKALQAGWVHRLSTAGLLAMAAALMLHVTPGFDNPVIDRNLRLSASSSAFDLYWNLDKGLVGLAFLLYLVPAKRLGHADLQTLMGAAGAGVLLAALLLPAAAAAGMLAWDPKLPAALLWWAPANLLITCLAEEAVFRGFLQERLSQWLGPQLPYGESLAIATTAVLFGAAHFAGGIGYVLFAAMAGLGYGLVYRYGGGLLGAVLAHFLLNTSHIVLFTYPLSAR